MSTQHIVFRVDASIQIGAGHVMRCLTLADALREQGSLCTFICRQHSGHMLDEIALRGHTAVALPKLTVGSSFGSAISDHSIWLGCDWQTDAQQTLEALCNEQVDWLVVDHYSLDRRWEHTIRKYCQNIMVIDDLVDRPHDCDVLLNQNLGRRTKDYAKLLKTSTRTFIGPEFALLRPEFAELRSQSLTRRIEPQLKKLLITMGGVDKDNATGKVLHALRAFELPSDLRITVVLGPHAPSLASVQTQASNMQCPTQVLVGVNNMAQLMAESDLAFGAAGTTSWERCCLGLPSIISVLAENQREISAALEDIDAAITIDKWKTRSLESFPFSLITKDNLKLLSKNAAEVTDGFGVNRVAAIIGGG